jgi:hypothetical protein
MAFFVSDFFPLSDLLPFFAHDLQSALERLRLGVFLEGWIAPVTDDSGVFLLLYAREQAVTGLFCLSVGVPSSVCLSNGIGNWEME